MRNLNKHEVFDATAKTEKKGIVYMENAWEHLKSCRNENDFKVVIASRYHRVCYDMGLHELSLVEGLSPDDAWNMFQATVGHLLSFPQLNQSLRRGKECDGSRPLIDKVARTFRKKEEKFPFGKKD
ncbi:hypothetical protein AAG906_014790 [Vitis piasezkii]